MKRIGSQESSTKALPPGAENLPWGWAEVRLVELGMGQTRGVVPATEPDTEFDLWSVPSFPSKMPETVLGRLVGSNKQRVRNGDLLLCKINPRINRVWVVRPQSKRPQIASTEWMVFRSPSYIPEFLMRHFRASTFRAALCRTVAGVGGSLTRARPQDVADLKIALPPLAEQRRIVARLEKLEARSRRAREALAEIPPLIAQARQSLLAAAFEGRLTEGWRQGKSLHSGVKIVKAMEAAHEETGGHKRGNAAQATEGVHNLMASDFPPSWGLTNLQNLCRAGRPVTYGILMPKSNQAHGVPYVRVADYPADIINLATIRRTTPEIDASYARSRLSGGDLLLSIRGTVGRVAVVPPELDGANITQDSVRLSITDYVVRDFVAYALRSPATQTRMRAAAKGVAVRGINVGDVRALQIPIPDLPEQREIVRRLDRAFARLDRLAALHAEAVAELDRFDHALLEKAFRGKLIPQDPRDEPASVLLERIRRERECAVDDGLRRRQREHARCRR